MKCASCGKEFGNGANCQYCGIDRVTGLGNYSGYSPAKNIPQSATYTEFHGNTYQEPRPVEDKNIICYNCGEVIPKDSKFCPYCSTNLYVTCPKCGKEYSSQFPACSECGTNRDEYNKWQAEKNAEYERHMREHEIRQKKFYALLNKWREEYKKDPEIINNKNGLFAEDKLAIACLEDELRRKEKDREVRLYEICHNIYYPDSNTFVRLTIILISIIVYIIVILLFYIFPIKDKDVHNFFVWVAMPFFIVIIDLILYSPIAGANFKIFSKLEKYISEKRRRKALFNYIREHPNDPDIDFLQKRYQEMVNTHEL